MLEELANRIIVYLVNRFWIHGPTVYAVLECLTDSEIWYYANQVVESRRDENEEITY